MSTTATEPTTVTVTVEELRTGLTELLAQVKVTGTPITVEGGFVVLPAADYLRLVEQADRLETLSGVLKSIKQIDDGQYVTLEEMDKKIRRKHFGGKP